MDLILMTLTPPAGAGSDSVGRQTLTDILWANVRPAGRIDHINVCQSPVPNSHLVAMFLPRPPTAPPSGGPPPDAFAAALRACRAAIANAPVLSGWTAAVYVSDLNLRP